MYLCLIHSETKRKKEGQTDNKLYDQDDLLVASKNVRYWTDQRTRLHILARSGDDRRVEILVKVGADVDAKETASKETPLHYASQQRHESVVQYLKEHGVK